MFYKIFVIMTFILFFDSVSSQSQCSTICELTPDCKNGKCSIAKCWERDDCLQFCLDCSGEKVCIQSGKSCPKDSTSIPFIVHMNNLIVSEPFLFNFYSRILRSKNKIIDPKNTVFE
ncbi:hypothetical protein BpHYR1_038728 [Brachionus plicatilis]|uniref:Uncharacterized protein n=1 Tax=Brachionus plicatilis TaxID=10195 RepID=A0A3M7SAL2_BRAPC|nr:hypothetical protein BpHYR1_038728 [Brachionus plicatilis]